MDRQKLHASIRSVIGRKVKNLRLQGQLPAVVYGKHLTSQSVTLGADEFVRVYDETGETGLIDLTVDGEVKPVLVHSVALHPLTGLVTHVEFHQVNLREKVHAKVPVVVVGQSPVVASNQGLVLTILDEVEVEALPTDLPDRLELDVSALTEVDQEFAVKDLVVPSGVTILTDSSQVMVRIGALVTKAAQEEEQAQVAAAAATAEAAPDATSPTEAPTPPPASPSENS